MRSFTITSLLIMLPIISSCVVSLPENRINTTYVMINEIDLCRLQRLDSYDLPDLPDLSDLGRTKIDELRALEAFAKHISELRADIRHLKTSECN